MGSARPALLRLSNPAFVPFAAAWLLLLIATGFVGSQSVATVLERLALGLFALAVPVAWYRGTRTSAVILAVIAIQHAVSSPPLVGRRSLEEEMTTWVTLGLLLAAMGINVFQVLRARSTPQSAARVTNEGER